MASSDTSNPFNYIVNTKSIDLNILLKEIDQICRPSLSLEELFSTKFCTALNHDLITLTNYFKDKKTRDNEFQNTDRSISGFDFVNYQHPSHQTLETLLDENQNNDVVFTNISRYFRYLNKVVFQIVACRKTIKVNSTFQSLPLLIQKQISQVKLRKSLKTRLTHVSATVEDMIDFLNFSAVKIEIPIDHFEYVINKNNIDDFKLLVQYSNNLDLVDNDGWTPLMHTAYLNQTDFLKILLHYGANPDIQNDDGNTALILSAKNESIQVLKYLIENRAGLDLQSNDGRTALMWAADLGNSECLILLIQNGADINKQNKDGMTALMIAASYGQYECLNLLIENSANINMESKYLWSTAIILAIRNGFLDCLKTLIENGAEQFTMINGYTLLQLAKGRNPKCYKLLKSYCPK